MPHQLNDVSVLTGFVTGTIGFVLLVAGLVIMVVMQISRKNLYAMDMKQKEYQFQNELLNSQIEVQEHLLNEVSKEIHDNVGQVLSLVKVHLFTIGNLVADQKAAELVDTSSQLLDKAIEDLRTISHTKNTGLLQRMGLEEMIRKELNYIDSLKNHQCEFYVSGEPFSLDAEKELLVYRIAQEAIHNSIKHSGCTKITVDLMFQPNILLLVVEDNGKGFDVEEKMKSGGIGLQHMVHRGRVLNADLDIISAQEKGTKISLTIRQES